MKFTDAFSYVTYCSDPKFFAIAYAEYAKSRAADFEAIMDLMSEAAEWDLEDDGDYPYDEKIAQIGFVPGCMIPVSGGFVTLRDALQAIITQGNTLDVWASGCPGYHTDGSTQKGFDINTVVQDVLDECEQCKAVSSALNVSAIAANAADRVALFKEELSTISAATVSSVSSKFEYYVSLLKSEMDVVSICANLSNATGADDIAESESPGFDLDQYDITQATGANPMGPLNFDGVSSAVGSVCKVGSKILSAGCKALSGFIKKGLSWLSNKVEEVTVNPNDLYTISSDGDLTIEGCGYHLVRSHALHLHRLYTNSEYIECIDPSLETVQSIIPLATEHFSKPGPIIWKTPFMTIESNSPVSFTLNNSSGSLGQSIVVQALNPIGVNSSSTFVMKPRVLNYQRLLSIFKTALGMDIGNKVTNDQGYRTFSLSNANLRDLFVACFNDPLLYVTAGQREDDSYRALFLAVQLGIDGLQALFNDDPQTNIYYPDNALIGMDNAAEDITNADWIALASNISGVFSTKVYVNDVMNKLIESDTFMASIAGCVWAIAIGQFFERKYYPLDWGFFPYSTDYANKVKSSFRIRTDAENAEAFNNLFTAIVIAVAVVAVALTLKANIKKFRFKKALQREQRMSILQQKMWNGETLTAKEAKQYKRAVRKGGVSSIFDKRSAPGDTVGSNAADATGVVNRNYEAITGVSLS